VSVSAVILPESIESLGYIFLADSMGLSLFKFSRWAPKDARFWKRVHNGPSLILAPIESAYATSYRSSIVTLVLSCPVSEILQVSREEQPHPYSTRILGVFPSDYITDVVAPRSEDPKLIIRAISFELIQPICPRYLNVTDRRTDCL